MKIGLAYPIFITVALLAIVVMIVDFSKGIDSPFIKAQVIRKQLLLKAGSTRKSYYVTVSGGGNIESIQVDMPRYNSLSVGKIIKVRKRTGCITHINYGLVL